MCGLGQPVNLKFFSQPLIQKHVAFKCSNLTKLNQDAIVFSFHITQIVM